MCAPCHDDWYSVNRNPGRRRLAVLDGCCGAGGASRGYADAGFEVWGVDNNRRLEADYLRSGATRFICGDILDVLADTAFANQFDFIHVSPPCQRYSRMSNCRPGLRDEYPDLIGPVRDRLEKLRRPWVIENVSPARPLLRDPVTLCGEMFQRGMYRHRLFEPGGGIALTAPSSDTELQRNKECGWHHPVAAAKAGHWRPGMYVSVSGHERKEPVRLAMGITWMSDREDVKEAIPPAFSQHIGRQVLNQLLYSRRRHTRVATQTVPNRLARPSPTSHPAPYQLSPHRLPIPLLPHPLHADKPSRPSPGRTMPTTRSAPFRLLPTILACPGSAEPRALILARGPWLRFMCLPLHHSGHPPEGVEPSFCLLQRHANVCPSAAPNGPPGQANTGVLPLDYETMRRSRRGSNPGFTAPAGQSGDDFWL
jgi:DNA (cytosine-5)-methyltransferase 1